MTIDSELDQPDAIVFLTWSNLKTEPRSNRYHYAKRMAQWRPVWFVQPDLDSPAVIEEESGIENVRILHVYNRFNRRQSELLNQALWERGVRVPLLWIYNFYFSDFVFSKAAWMKIYHATEDYFEGQVANFSRSQLQEFKLVLRHMDLIVAVSPGVASSYKAAIQSSVPIRVNSNGCDFAALAIRDSEVESALERRRARRVVLFQGGITYRVDFDLLEQIIVGLSDVEFRFAGEVSGDDGRFQEIQKLPNVVALGRLSFEDLRGEMLGANVGLIPYRQEPWILKPLWPLKAFEYLSVGLPVVSVPIEALLTFADGFLLADTAETFILQIKRALELSGNRERLLASRLLAKSLDYDTIIKNFIKELQTQVQPRQKRAHPRILVGIYNPESAEAVSYVSEFGQLDVNGASVHFVNLPYGAISASHLLNYDSVVIWDLHESATFWNTLKPTLPKDWRMALPKFSGWKIWFGGNPDGIGESFHRVEPATAEAWQRVWAQLQKLSGPASLRGISTEPRGPNFSHRSYLRFRKIMVGIFGQKLMSGIKDLIRRAVVST